MHVSLSNKNSSSVIATNPSSVVSSSLSCGSTKSHLQEILGAADTNRYVILSICDYLNHVHFYKHFFFENMLVCWYFLANKIKTKIYVCRIIAKNVLFGIYVKECGFGYSTVTSIFSTIIIFLVASLWSYFVENTSFVTRKFH